MDSQCRCPDVIVGASVCNDNHDLALVGFGFAEKLLCGVGDGGTGAGPAAPVVDALDGVQQLGLVVVLAEGKLQPLLVGVLHSSDPRVRVRDLKLPRDVGHELQHRAEVAGSHAAGAVDDEGDVVGVEAGFAAHQAVCVTHSLHQGLHGLPQSKPAGHGQGEEAVRPAHSLWDEGNTLFQNCRVLMKHGRTSVTILHLVNKVGLNQVLLLVVIRALDGDEEYVDARLPSEPRRLLHLVCGPAVHQDHGRVRSSSSVSVGITEVLLVDVGEGLSCQGTRGQQGDS